MQSWKASLMVLTSLLLVTSMPAQQAHRQGGATREPRIEITEVPSSDCGGPDTGGSIAGKVTAGTDKSYLIVIYSRGCNQMLYVQPTVADPFTDIDSDGTFGSYIHLGVTYYILLVRPGFKPKPEMTKVPEKGGDIVAVAQIRGKQK